MTQSKEMNYGKICQPHSVAGRELFIFKRRLYESFLGNLRLDTSHLTRSSEKLFQLLFIHTYLEILLRIRSKVSQVDIIIS